MPLSPGQTLNNRYRITTLLGQGGFGAVYRAWDLNIKAPCAVKENLDTSHEAQRQFEHEAVILANLHHPNLPRVSDHFIIPGQGQYLVMDFVAGDNLQQLLEQSPGPLSEDQVLQWLSQICDALTYLHAQKPPIIHRDIKPANIKITPDGRAMLVDFGIAKVFDPHLKTTVGARAITPGYSPPEQYGQGTTDGRSDIYALGATLYTALTGQQPTESVQRTIGAPLTSPRQINQSISPRTEAIILKAMSTAPTGRFQSAVELKNVLAGQAAIPLVSPMGTPLPSVTLSQVAITTAPAVALPRRLPSWVWIAGAGALLVGLVLVIIVISLLVNPPGSGPASQTALAHASTHTAEARLEARNTTHTAEAQAQALESITPTPIPTTQALPTSVTSTPMPTFPNPPGLTATPTISAQFIMYTVQAGDTLASIAARFGTDIPTLLALNPSIDPATQILYVGQQLIIPAGNGLTPTATAFIPPTPTTSALPTLIYDAFNIPMALVPAGSFSMGGDPNVGYQACLSLYVNHTSECRTTSFEDAPLHSVTLSDYYIDLYEVTNAQYYQCVIGGGCPAPEREVSQSRSFYFENPDYDYYPVLYVNWQGAMSYCQWRGGSLPSEAQWEKAARGTDGRIYPWGNNFDGSRLNFCDASCASVITADWANLTFNDGYGDTSPIASYSSGVSPYGVYDLAGNVWEWTADWYERNYYSISPTQDPTGPPGGDYRVVRGGSWSNSGYPSLTFYRDVDDPSGGHNNVGFRCVLIP